MSVESSPKEFDVRSTKARVFADGGSVNLQFVGADEFFTPAEAVDIARALMAAAVEQDHALRIFVAMGLAGPDVTIIDPENEIKTETRTT